VSSRRESSTSSQTSTPSTPPMSGNTMKAQNCSQASLLPDHSTAPKLRAGFTDVLSTGMVTQWMSASVKPTTSPPCDTVNFFVVVLSTTNTSSAVNTISTTSMAPKL